MKYFHPTIESHMRKTAGRWNVLRYTRIWGTLGAAASLAVLLTGVCMWRGWLENPYMAGGILGALILITFLAWLITFAVIFTSNRYSRSWIAGHLEKGHTPLLDRINTLVFLGEKKSDAEAQSYAGRIEKQASEVLKDARPRSSFPVLRPLLHVVVFAVILAGTIWFYSCFQPWRMLMAAWNRKQIPLKEAVQDFKLPDTITTEEKKKAWSEVRITDPANDIKATKVDVVPLEIEAASSESLKKVAWALSVDGGKEEPRPLDAPAEPHYAVYQPMLSLDELQLSDWDVVSYYAKASTDDGGSSSSELYFIEIRPFREDLLKMPGGEGGQAMQTLGELTTLIERQRVILRQTHRYEQQPNPDLKTKETDHGKLVDAESELGDSVTHVYAKLAANFENKPIGDTLDHLALAQNDIDHATTELRNDFPGAAIPLEQGALTELAATRKNFQKFINEHPDSFDDKNPTPVADTGQLAKIAEFRDSEKAAANFLQKSLEKQKDLAGRAQVAGPKEYGGLKNEQDDLAKSVSDFESQNPGLFKDLNAQSAAAQAAMKKASTALKVADDRSKVAASRSAASGTNANLADLFKSLSAALGANAAPTPGGAAKSHINAVQQNAVSSLQDLKDGFAGANTQRQIEHAHELKKLLDHQANDIDQAGSNPGSASSSHLQQTAQGAGQTVGQLKDIIDSTGAGKAFGPQLHDALSGAQQSKLSEQLSRLSQAKDDASRQSAAQDAAKSLHGISKAFDQSLPSTMQQAQKTNPLSPGDQEAFDQAMKEMESMQAAAQNGSPMSPASQTKQREDARLALMKSIPELYGNDGPTKALLAQIDQQLKNDGKPVDMEALKKLTDQIQNFRIEMSDKKTEKPDKEEISHIDPSKLPPEYRERVERYFQKLSEQ